MKTEFIRLSIAGAVGLFFAGLMLGSCLAGNADAGHIVLLVMLLVLLRADAREDTPAGTYERGWLVWRRTGPHKSSDDSGVSA